MKTNIVVDNNFMTKAVQPVDMNMGESYISKTQQFLDYINHFRGMAILFIVFGHCISAFNWEASEDLSRLLKIIFSNGSVLFVFIAGYLFQHLSLKFLFSRYFYNKLLNVGLPYILCSIPAILYFVFIEKRWDVPPEFYLNSKHMQIILFYLTGAHMAHFWFIPMIFIYYLISPLLIFLDKKFFLYYLIPISIVYYSNFGFKRHKFCLNFTISNFSTINVRNSPIYLSV